MSNVTKVMNLKIMTGQTGLGLSNDKFIHKHILSSKSVLTHDVGPLMVITLVAFDILN